MADKNKKTNKAITDEIASVGTLDITRGYIGQILTNPDSVLALEGSSLGLKLYDDLERDDRVYPVLQTRKNAVSGKAWQILSASEDQSDIDVAEFVENVFRALPFGDIIKSLLDSRLKGFAIAEIIWHVRLDGKIGIKEIIGRDQRRFVFDLDRLPRLLTPKNLISGEEVPHRKFIHLAFGSKFGSPYGSGLGSRLYWPCWFKKNGTRFWAIFLEKFGSPTAVGKYPSGTLKTQQQALLEAMAAIQNESSVKIPDNMTIDLLEASRQGSTDSYEKFMNYWDKAISIVVLGQTLTTDVGDSGSRALGDVHNEVRHDLVKDDADDISEVLSCQLIPWLVDFNFAGVVEYPRFSIATDPKKDTKALAERDVLLIEKVGLPVSEDYFYKTYDIPRPEAGETLVQGPNPPQSPFSKGGSSQLLPHLEKGGQGGIYFARDKDQQADKLDPFVDQAMEKVNLDPIIDPIKKLTEEATSLEELKEMLLKEYENIDPVRLGDLIQETLATSELLGRFEAE